MSENWELIEIRVNTKKIQSVVPPLPLKVMRMLQPDKISNTFFLRLDPIFALFFVSQLFSFLFLSLLSSSNSSMHYVLPQLLPWSTIFEVCINFKCLCKIELSAETLIDVFTAWICFTDLFSWDSTPSIDLLILDFIILFRFQALFKHLN